MLVATSVSMMEANLEEEEPYYQQEELQGEEEDALPDDPPLQDESLLDQPAFALLKALNPCHPPESDQWRKNFGTVKLTELVATLGQNSPHNSNSSASHQTSIFNPRVTRSNAEQVKSKIDIELGFCSEMSKAHAKIKFNAELGKFELHIIGKHGIWVNDAEYVFGCKPILLSSKDKIEIRCKQHLPGAHGFWFLLPRGAADSFGSIAGIATETAALKNFISKDHKQWTKSEREKFMKGILAFGHTRTKLVKEHAGLNNRSLEEVHEFTISFFYRLLEFLTPEEKEERAYALTILKKENLKVLWDLDANDGSRAVEPSLFSWKKVEKSAGQWLRRLRNIHALHEIMMLHHDYGVDILLGMSASFLKQRSPADWWKASDDRYLLMGVHKHGYSNFDEMRNDPEFQFTPVPPGDEWPNAEKLNKRVKKLMDHIRELYANQSNDLKKLEKESYSHYEKEVLRFNPMKVIPVEKSSKVQKVQPWTADERQRFVATLMKFGLRRTYNGLVDWEFIRNAAGLTEKLDTTLARLYVGLAKEMLKNVKLEDQTTENSFFAETMFLVPEVSKNLYNRILLCEDLRKIILLHSSTCDDVIRELSPPAEDLPSWWTRDHDVAICHAAFQVGFSGWADITLHPSLSWVYDLLKDRSPLPKPQILNNRVSELVESVKAFYVTSGQWTETPQPSELSTRHVKSAVSPEGTQSIVYRSSQPPHEILYPVSLEPGLKLLSVGAVLNLDDKSIPVGYHAVRLYRSIFNLTSNVEYHCKIHLDEANEKVVFSINQMPRPGVAAEDFKFEADSADAVWAKLEQAIAFRQLPGDEEEGSTDDLSAVEERRSLNDVVKNLTPPGTGDRMFGLNSPIVQELLGQVSNHVQFVFI